MERDDDQQDVEEPDVPVRDGSDRFLADLARERSAVQVRVVVVGEEPEQALRANEAEHDEHDRAAERVVTEKIAWTAQQEIDAVADGRPRSVGERAEA